MDRNIATPDVQGDKWKVFIPSDGLVAKRSWLAAGDQPEHYAHFEINLVDIIPFG